MRSRTGGTAEIIAEAFDKARQPRRAPATGLNLAEVSPVAALKGRLPAQTLGRLERFEARQNRAVLERVRALLLTCPEAEAKEILKHLR
jgi:hypothetical protein